MLQSRAWVYASSPTRTVYVNMTLTRSKVKVKVTNHLNFWQLPINAQVYLLRHLRVELKADGWYRQYGTWSTACRRPIFDFRSRKGITTIQTSRNVDISRHSNDHIAYFGTGWCHSHMVGYAGPTVYVDVTLTRSKVKVKVTGFLNFRQLAKPCMLAAMTAAPLRGFLIIIFIPM